MEHPAAPPYQPPPPAQAGVDGGSFYPNSVFAAVLGYRPLLLDLRVPSGPGPFPVVVQIHGGAWWEGSRLPLPELAGGAFPARVLGRGYAVADVDYRLSREAAFPAQLHDVKAAIRWLRAFADQLRLDTDRFAAWGDSAGGHLAALAGLTGGTTDPYLEGVIGVQGPTSAVQAVVDWYGVATLGNGYQDGRPSPDFGPDDPAAWLLGGPVAGRSEAARRASPVRYAHAAAPPFLCLHGTSDEIVPHFHSELLAAALREQGAHCELDLVAGGHGFEGTQHTELVERSLDFLDRALGG